MAYITQVERLRTRKGIGLIELMLVLTVISLIIVMATRYYQTAERSRKVTQAISQVNAVVAAAQRWRLGKSGFDNTMTVAVLVAQGMLPKEMQDGRYANPWGGDITINTAYSGGGQFVIQLTNVDSQDCNLIVSTLTNSSNFVPWPQGGNVCMIGYLEKTS